MDHYIVKIYRRDHDNPRKVAGLVQHVKSECVRPFSTLDELTEILATMGTICRRKRKFPVKECRRKGGNGLVF